jgi:GntR family transcriptional regulator, transcriptional repressor for pyruvate dehydrogenase complex
VTRRETARPAYEALAAALRAQIMSGELKPGDRLPVEPDLSALHGVSRSTVREALRVLSSQHLITTTRGVVGGSFVAHPQPEQISGYLETGFSLMALFQGVTVDRLLEVRDMLEVPAAGLAALRHEPGQLDELRATLFDPGGIPTDGLFPRNRSFHEALLRMAGNPLLEVVTQPVFRVLGERFVREAAPKRFWSQVDADHRSILAAVAAGDEDAARAAMHDHLGRLRTIYTRIDRERPGKRASRGPRSGTPFLDRESSDV